MIGSGTKSGSSTVVLPSLARTSSGSSGLLPVLGQTTTLRCQLDVTAVAGTTPSLAVVLEDTIDGVNFYTIATFAVRTAAGREAVNVTSPFTDTLRVSFAITGTTPSFTFAVAVYAEG